MCLSRQPQGLPLKNARIPFAELGRQVNLSAAAVAERVRKMEESGIIEGYHAEVNMEKLSLMISASQEHV